MNANPQPPTARSPLKFFLWLFLISVPFWLIGPVVDQLLPADFPINLPVSALMTFNPLIVALLLLFRENGMSDIETLLKRIFDGQHFPDKRWFLPVFLLMPLLTVIEYGLIMLLGTSIPDPQVPILYLPLMFIVFFVTAAGEELGWMGYAYDPLRERFNALGTSLILGIVWALWHFIAYLQMDNSLSWVVWQCVATVGLRVLIVWVYNNTGNSLFAAIIFHAMINVGNFMFPNYGSYYDPFVASIVITVTAVLVVLVWKPTKLSHSRF